MANVHACFMENVHTLALFYLFSSLPSAPECTQTGPFEHTHIFSNDESKYTLISLYGPTNAYARSALDTCSLSHTVWCRTCQAWDTCMEMQAFNMCMYMHNYNTCKCIQSHTHSQTRWAWDTCKHMLAFKMCMYSSNSCRCLQLHTLDACHRIHVKHERATTKGN